MQLDVTPQTFIKGTIEYSKPPVSRLLSILYNAIALDDSTSDELLSKDSKKFRGAKAKISNSKKLVS